MSGSLSCFLEGRMKNKTLGIVVGLAAGLFLSFICLNLAYAQPREAPPPDLNNDDEKREAYHARQKITWDFLQVAFSPNLWMETVEDQIFVLRTYAVFDLNFAALREAAWFSALVKDTHNPAPLGVINKWTQTEIPVFIGWPSPAMGLFAHSPEVEASSAFIERVRAVTVNVAKASGIRLLFVAPSKEGGNRADYRGIHIVPVSKTGLHNKYKSYIVDASYMRHPRVLVPQTLLTNAVEFSPYSRSQVDGFFVPNDKNEIQFAACRILSTLNPDMQVALISECILRSLGLPSSVSFFRGLPYNDEEVIERLQLPKKNFFLGNWNSDKDAVSKTIFYDSEAAIDFNIKRPNPVVLGVDGSGSDERVASFLLESVRARSVTDRDIQLLKLLYCEDIKAGSNRSIILSMLVSEGKCY